MAYVNAFYSQLVFFGLFAIVVVLVPESPGESEAFHQSDAQCGTVSKADTIMARDPCAAW